MTICKVFLKEGNQIQEYLISLSNLSSLIRQQKKAKELVITGHHDFDQFVIRIEKGQIVFCNNAKLRDELAEELNNMSKRKSQQLVLFEVVVSHSFTTNILYIFSLSEEQAKSDLREWSTLQTVHFLRIVA